jgi:hypothetical protein
MDNIAAEITFCDLAYAALLERGTPLNAIVDATTLNLIAFTGNVLREVLCLQWEDPSVFIVPSNI